MTFEAILSLMIYLHIVSIHIQFFINNTDIKDNVKF